MILLISLIVLGDWQLQHILIYIYIIYWVLDFIIKKIDFKKKLTYII